MNELNPKKTYKDYLKHKNWKLRYSLAVICSLTAIFLQIYTQRFIGTNHFHILYPSIFFIAWYLGFGPSLLSLIIMTAGCLYILEPVGQIYITGKERWTSVIAFFSFSLIFSWLVHLRRKTAMALAVRTAELETLANNLPQLAWKTDKFGRLSWVNQRWQDYTGLTLEETRKNYRTKIHHPKHYARVTKKFFKNILAGSDWEDTFPILSKSGECRWHLSRATPVRNSDGEILSWFGTNTDIDDKLQTESELRDAKEKAESANQAKSYFLANMSHEIRTPLGIIMGYLDLIKNPDITKKENVEYMNVIEQNSQQLMKLINDILDVSKMEAGKLEIKKKNFSIRDLLSELSSSIAIMAKEKGIHFEILFNSTLPDVIRADPDRLRQILMNLINNAMKFTVQGAVKLSVHVKNETNLVFEVTDTGYGISPESVSKLFRPFSQADNSLTRQFGGTGLGLALSKKLAQAMGGDLFLHSSKVNEGSIFKVIIPFINVKKLTPQLKINKNKVPLQLVPNKSSLEGVNILLVEDSLDNQRIVTTFLKRTGATVDSANDGLEGVTKALAERQKYDVVLMDIQMPHMDGYQATEKLRAAGYDTPIIALTAHALSEERDKSLAAGFSEHLTKPFNKLELIDTINRYVH